MIGTPEIVFVNGNVITVDDNFTVTEAVAIRDGVITAVGTNAEINALAGPDTEIVSLEGQTLLPGFVEAHGHPTTEMNLIGPGSIDIRAAVCPTTDSVLSTLRDAVKRASADDWVVAFGWDPLLVPDLPPISGRLLTELSPDVPLSVMHYSAHSSWANEAALSRLGLDSSTADPVGSAFIRDESGNLTGEGREVPASMILMGPKLEVRPDTFSSLLDFELRRFAAAGITTTGDMAFEPAAYRPVAEYFRTHASPVRIRSYEISGARSRIPHPPTQDPMFRPVGVKVWSDGSPWIGNIETSFAYCDSPETHAIGVHPGHRGCSNYTPAQLLDICRTYLGQGWQLSCHVHGDIAVDTVLDTFERVQNETGRRDLRLRMEHCGSITPAQVRRAHHLGVTISFFVAHIYYYGEVLRGLFGDRADQWTPAGAAAACGMPFSLHNDPPVTPETPLLNIRTAITRTSRTGTVLGLTLGIDVREAIKAQTIYPAWQLHSEHEIGSIEPGKFADFVVLADDPLTTPADQIDTIRVVETWLDGRRVALDAPTPASRP